MFTFAICLIYYGIAVWLYQLIGWFRYGKWSPYPIRKAWEAFVGHSTVQSDLLSTIADGILDLPLGLTLVLLGLFVISTRFSSIALEAIRERWERRRWILEQCKKMGLFPWVVPEILEELEKDDGPGKGKNRVR